MNSTNKVVTKKPVLKLLKVQLQAPPYEHLEEANSSYQVDNLGYAKWELFLNQTELILKQLELIKIEDFCIKSFNLTHYKIEQISPEDFDESPIVQIADAYPVQLTTFDMENRIFSRKDIKNKYSHNCDLCFELTMEIYEYEVTEIEPPHLKLMNDYEKMLNDAPFSDVVIKTKSGNILRGHKNILTARSPVFAAMLSTDMKEKNTNEITITDEDPDVLQQMLLFIYSGKFSDYEKCYDLFVAADKYQIEDLMKCIQNCLRQNFNDKSIINCLKIAESYDKQDLRKAAIEFIIRNYDEMKPVIEGKEWLDLISQYPALNTDIMQQFYLFLQMK